MYVLHITTDNTSYTLIWFQNITNTTELKQQNKISKLLRYMLHAWQTLYGKGYTMDYNSSKADPCVCNCIIEKDTGLDKSTTTPRQCLSDCIYKVPLLS